MNIFYNPKTKKPHVWVLIVFALIPIIVIILSIIISNTIAKNNIENKTSEPEVDIFEKL